MHRNGWLQILHIFIQLNPRQFKGLSEKYFLPTVGTAYHVMWDWVWNIWLSNFAFHTSLTSPFDETKGWWTNFQGNQWTLDERRIAYETSVHFEPKSIHLRGWWWWRLVFAEWVWFMKIWHEKTLSPPTSPQTWLKKKSIITDWKLDKYGRTCLLTTVQNYFSKETTEYFIHEPL